MGVSRGSVARAEDRSASDIDLMVISDTLKDAERDANSPFRRLSQRRVGVEDQLRARVVSSSTTRGQS